jgi:hypothetical protein
MKKNKGFLSLLSEPQIKALKSRVSCIIYHEPQIKAIFDTSEYEVFRQIP